MSSDRLDALEAALAHAEAAIDDLSDMVRLLSGDIEALKVENALLRRRLRRLEEPEGDEEESRTRDSFGE
jgi:uncharacterized coiled-coil protein SlyX